MYSITWITPLTGELFVLALPSERTALRAYLAIRKTYKTARLWYNVAKGDFKPALLSSL